MSLDVMFARWASEFALWGYTLFSLLLLVSNIRWAATGGLLEEKEPVLNDTQPPAVYLLLFRIGWRAVLLIFIALRPQVFTTFALRCRLPRLRVIWKTLVWWLAILIVAEATATISWLARHPSVFFNDEDVWRSDSATRAALAVLRFGQVFFDTGHTIFSFSLIYYVLLYKVEMLPWVKGKAIWHYLTTHDDVRH